jgi:CRISPR-associated endonuclease Csn1
LRVRWGLLKDADESERYHGIDALVVAAVVPNLTKQLAEASREQELGQGNSPETRSKNHLPQPWEGFSQAVRDYVDNDIFVSRMPCRKLTGAAHQETVRSAKHLDEGYAVVKTPLSNLTLQNLESLHDKERNVSLYNALKARLAEYEGNGKKAFEEPFYMPLSAKKTKCRSSSPRVKSVKLRVSMNDGVPC